MPRFEIDWITTWKKKPRELKLNDEWKLRLAGSEFHPKIQIERRSYNREDLVSGYLHHLVVIDGDFYDIFMKKFSKKLVPQQVFETIIPYEIFDINQEIAYYFKGHVIITKHSDKIVVGLQNEQSTEGNVPNSKENGESKNEIPQEPLRKLSYDFEKLLDGKTSSLSDVTLKCGDVAIPAHKIILSARSPVFAAMFSSPMKESSKNEVDISDIDVTTVRSLLMYMYTGKTSFTDSSAIDLLIAADKYQLEELKSVCAHFLRDTLSLHNVLKILVLGDMVDAGLKSFAVDYICSKSAEFSALENTEEWKALLKDNPALSMETLTSLVKSMNEKLKI